MPLILNVRQLYLPSLLLAYLYCYWPGLDGKWTILSNYPTTYNGNPIMYVNSKEQEMMTLGDSSELFMEYPCLLDLSCSRKGLCQGLCMEKMGYEISEYGIESYNGWYWSHSCPAYQWLSDPANNGVLHHHMYPKRSATDGRGMSTGNWFKPIQKLLWRLCRDCHEKPHLWQQPAKYQPDFFKSYLATADWIKDWPTNQDGKYVASCFLDT